MDSSVLTHVGRRGVRGLARGIFWIIVALIAFGLLIVVPLVLVLMIAGIISTSTVGTSLLVIGLVLVFTVFYFGMIRMIESRDLASWDGGDEMEVGVREDEEP